MILPKKNSKDIFRHFSLLIVAMLPMLIASCRHKDLYMEEDMTSQLQVVFDWSKAPEADPESMAMYLYEDNGRKPMRYIFSNKTGGLIKAPFGTHHALCMNADNTDWACIRNHENIETMEIYTLDSNEIGTRADDITTIPRPQELKKRELQPLREWSGATGQTISRLSRTMECRLSPCIPRKWFATTL